MIIRVENTVVEPVDGDTFYLDIRRQSAKPIPCFKHDDVMSVLRKVVSGAQP